MAPDGVIAGSGLCAVDDEGGWAMGVGGSLCGHAVIFWAPHRFGAGMFARVFGQVGAQNSGKATAWQGLCGSVFPRNAVNGYGTYLTQGVVKASMAKAAEWPKKIESCQ